MRRIVLMLVVLVTGGLIGLAVGVADVALAAEAEKTEAPAAATAFDAPPGRLEFVGENLFSTANGTFHRWRIVEQAVDPTAIPESFAVVEIDLASVDTGIEQRDKHLRDPDFFEVETYPTARVRFHSPTPDGRTESGQRRFKARFDIDLHGVKKTLDGVVVVEREDPLRLTGTLVLDRTDFGVGGAASRWNPMAVKAEIPIRFEVEP